MAEQAEFSDARCYVEVTPQPLDLLKYTAWVGDPGAGAIATFIGVTRDSFQGQRTARLEYEAYVPMAVAKLRELCAEAGRRWALAKLAVAHRTGVVLVGEPSVVIAASSAHRREALEVRTRAGWSGVAAPRCARRLARYSAAASCVSEQRARRRARRRPATGRSTSSRPRCPSGRKSTLRAGRCGGRTPSRGRACWRSGGGARGRAAAARREQAARIASDSGVQQAHCGARTTA
jgi:molybdopterin synthase catalytic subunit